MIDQVSAHYKGAIPRAKGHPCQISWTCSGVLNICLSVPQLQDMHLTKVCEIDLGVSVMCTVSHSTSYWISSVVTYKLNQSLTQQTTTA